jgi:molybdopterin/thiamine biosynthesis adenylyltransferase
LRHQERAIVVAKTSLTPRDKERYRRNISVEGFGEKGQLKLSRSTVGIVGLGGLGSPAAMYLAAAGVGGLILADDQAAELSNLNRQLLHWENDVTASKSKVESASWKLMEMRSDLRIEGREDRVIPTNVADLMKDADVVLDCTDNFDVRMALNSFCVEADVPFVHAAVEGMYGQLTTVVPGKSPCLRCLFTSNPPRKEVPVLGPTAGVLGALQAMEAIKLITKVGDPLTGKLLVIDLRCNSYEIVVVDRDEKCPVCSL